MCHSEATYLISQNEGVLQEVGLCICKGLNIVEASTMLIPAVAHLEK